MKNTTYLLLQEGKNRALCYLPTVMGVVCSKNAVVFIWLTVKRGFFFISGLLKAFRTLSVNHIAPVPDLCKKEKPIY